MGTSSPRPFVITAVILITVASLHAAGIIAPITRPITDAILSLSARFHNAGVVVDDVTSNVLDAQRDDSKVLTAQMDSLVLENAKLRNILEENEELKAALSFNERQTDSIILSRVVSETADSSFHGLIIDKGADDGIHEGAPVLTVDGVMIGKIYAIRDQVSSVRLLTDSGSRLAVAIRNGSDTLGALEGERGLSTTISLIPQGEIVTPGDIIVTSGSEPGIRRGYPVGTIEKVNRSTQDPFQTASVIPFKSALRPIFVQIVMQEIAL